MPRKKSGLVVVISGPSGIGKTVLVNELLKTMPNSARLVTVTTRSPRVGEVNGRDYFFMSKIKFKNLIKKRQLLEYTYFKNRDQYCGSRKADFDKPLRQGKILFFNCDIMGLKTVKKLYPKNYLSIFIGYDTFKDIKKRLLKRNPNITAAEFRARLDSAKKETLNKKHYDRVIINRHGELEKTVSRARKIIQNKIKTA